MRSVWILSIIGLVGGCARLTDSQVPEPPWPQALAVVFDIDGTLTPDVQSIATVRPDASQAVRRYFDKGYRVVYLSTRSSLLQNGIPGWLKAKAFPEGSIHVGQTSKDDKDPALFKLRILKEYQARGWRLIGGYGDSSTDFEAYAGAGIPKNLVFALRRKGASRCQPGAWQSCLQGWTEHLTYIDQRRD